MINNLTFFRFAHPFSRTITVDMTANYVTIYNLAYGNSNTFNVSTYVTAQTTKTTEQKILQQNCTEQDAVSCHSRYIYKEPSNDVKHCGKKYNVAF
jgi:hypothetical protein